MVTRLLALCFCIFHFVKCGYPPIGDEVQPGSVLLPATRRGRYLANIVRRQAVDGTGIKFNKDADRMNAEAKKKVDVLSEELLPYIIAEQERRTTLYKRVMTAIQNGEKGVTIAEIRNKPPLIIRKGLMFRCPANRVPKEPDGSGIIMCENDIEPTPVMYDSCLSAEDKDLYKAENKYFFCNRHKAEGPDLPRNGTTVIGCAPPERTSLNYTSMKCALEDTDDVVVHYRYYPDRTYKFVTELDPDREVCDHWNPCQIGYIYSLPSPDQALPANELWRDYEDTKTEFVYPNQPYVTAPRRVHVPPGYRFDSVWNRQDPYTNNVHPAHKIPEEMIHIKESPSSVKRRSSSRSARYITIIIAFRKFFEDSYGTLYAVLVPEDKSYHKEKSVLLVTLEKTSIILDYIHETVMPQTMVDPITIDFKCQKCRVQGIVVHGDNGLMYNLDTARYKSVHKGDGKKAVQIQLKNVKAKDLGTYMITFQNDEGVEEVLQAMQLHVLKASVIRSTAIIGEHLDRTVNYACDGCELTDVICNGESVTSGGRVSIVTGVKMISFNFPSFEDANACVYMGIYKMDDTKYRKKISIIDTESVSVVEYTSEAPPYGEPFEFEVKITCEYDCEVVKVTVNGVEIEKAPTRRSGDGPTAYYLATSTSITVQVAEFSEIYEGTYMATFKLDHDTVTKIIADIKESTEDQDDNVAEETTHAPADPAASDSSDAATSEAAEGAETTEAAESADAGEAADTGDAEAVERAGHARRSGTAAPPTTSPPASTTPLAANQSTTAVPAVP